MLLIIFVYDYKISLFNKVVNLKFKYGEIELFGGYWYIILLVVSCWK